MATKRCVNCGKTYDPLQPGDEFCSKWCERDYDRKALAYGKGGWLPTAVVRVRNTGGAERIIQ